MVKIALLSTGGTIASTADNEGRGIAGRLPGEELTRNINLRPEISLEVHSVLQKPSNAVTFADLCTLHHKCQELINGNQVDGIVITHGTDMLEDTAYFLETTISTVKVPIIVTGSQRVPYANGTDAYTNLEHAIHTAASPQAKGKGVLVVFNETVYSAAFARKVSSFQLNGFDSPGYGCLGVIDNGSLHLYNSPVRMPVINIAADTYNLPNVEIVNCYLGGSEYILQACINSPDPGLVINGVGRGQVLPTWAKLIKQATDKGKKVLVTTSVLHGPVHQSYSYPGALADAEEAGAIGVSRVSARKARIRLSVLLSQGINSESAIKTAFMPEI